jgi:hypothetical protein
MLVAVFSVFSASRKEPLVDVVERGGFWSFTRVVPPGAGLASPAATAISVPDLSIRKGLRCRRTWAYLVGQATRSRRPDGPRETALRPHVFLLRSKPYWRAQTPVWAHNSRRLAQRLRKANKAFC